MSKHTPGPWRLQIFGQQEADLIHKGTFMGLCGGSGAPARLDEADAAKWEANARIMTAAPEMLAALKEGRRAIGDHHYPDDCYATGPITGDPIRDLVQCPACSFIAMHDAAIAKAEGRS